MAFDLTRNTSGYNILDAIVKPENNKLKNKDNNQDLIDYACFLTIDKLFQKAAAICNRVKNTTMCIAIMLLICRSVFISINKLDRFLVG
jgi:hypothetical protein